VSTIDYFREQGDRLTNHMAEETSHLYHKWGSQDATADELKALSSIAAAIGAQLYRVAGDALEMAEKLDPTPVGFGEDRWRAGLRLVKAEEIAAEVAAGEHAENVS